MTNIVGRLGIGVVSVLLSALTACGGSAERPAVPAATSSPLPTATALPSLAEDLTVLLSRADEYFDPERIARVGESGDIRLAWIVSDLRRFVNRETTPASVAAIEQAFWTLTGQPESDDLTWTSLTNYLIAQDVPPPEDYQRWKALLYLRFVEEWEPFFEDPDADVDWRYVSWGGVGIDDRALDEVKRVCSCIPALDDPLVTDAAGGDWYDDDRLVFGVVVNGEARAYPKHQMEVHELVNDNLGGRRIGLVYCTLCGTAQAFFTDELPAGVETPTGTLELRTSGLLARSNKVMFDLHTFSFFDTFRGQAISGPLQDADLELSPVSVSVARWGDWKAGHPDTTVIAEDAGLRRSYPLDPLRGRDDAGPIFPVGEIDPRLAAQDQVLGVRSEGLTVAFPEATARVALAVDDTIEYEGVTVRLVAGALAAYTSSGEPIETHQSFWFAWSQFFPETTVWGGD